MRVVEWLRPGLIRIGEALWVVWPVSTPALALALLAVSLTIWALIGDLPTGFTGKTLWDWIDVLGVPIVAVVVAGLFALAAQGASQRAEVERELNADRAQEATLRAYLDRMTDLIIDKGLRNSKESLAARAVAHAHTFTALRSLNGPRKGILLQFLHEAGLISKGTTVIPLSLADLRRADLGRADLSGSDLRGANMSNADLYEADLTEANLHSAVLYEADLREANLRNAEVTDEQLAEALSLTGATMSDGSEMTEQRWQEYQQQFS